MPATCQPGIAGWGQTTDMRLQQIAETAVRHPAETPQKYSPEEADKIRSQFSQTMFSLIPDGQFHDRKFSPEFEAENFDREIHFVLNVYRKWPSVEVSFDWLEQPDTDYAAPQPGGSPDSHGRYKGLQDNSLSFIKWLGKIVKGVREGGFAVVALGADSALDKFYKRALPRFAGLRPVPNTLGVFENKSSLG